MEWEKEAPYLASLPRATPYRVPDTYFNELPSHINQAVFLGGLMQKENQGFIIPQNYFEDLTGQIENRIAEDRIHELIKEDGFKVPSNYFDKLKADILNQTSQKKAQPKVMKLWRTDMMKYASAACFILIAASGLYINQLNNLKQARKAEIANEQVLYDIDESVIIEHLQESQTANNSASDTEMENYILDNFSSNDISNNL